MSYNNQYSVKLGHATLHGVRGGMANVRLQPPEPFNFKCPDEWPKWKRRFEQFRTASGLAVDEDQTRQVSTLLYCLGGEADDVLTSTNITEEERKQYASVLKKFDDFFKVRRNVIFERARFNGRNQLDAETAESYITVLYGLVENCEYGALRDEMLRDRLVVGIRDKSLSEKLQLDAVLTLEKAKTAIRQREAVKEQHQQLQGGAAATLESVKQWNKGANSAGRRASSSRRPTPGNRQGANQGANQGAGQLKGNRCTRCGRPRHQRGEKCPAAEVICHRCNKKGHFKAQCFSKNVSSANEVSLETAYLDTMTTGQQSSWTAKVKIEGKDIQFKLDTGAEVTAISEKTYKSLRGIALSKPKKSLYGPAHQPLQITGQFYGRLSHRGKSFKGEIFVVKGLKTNLLGLPAITSLQLIQRLCPVQAASTKREVQENFPTVFKGLGTLGEEYQIQLKEGAKPNALFSPRNVPIALRSKVQEELKRMESMGVISKVDQHTPWCAGMVVVPKKTGNVRICVDLKPLNESVLREVHPIPKVDDTLAQLAGMKLFSKLDANSGFWQIPLAEESKLLTTFITPFGRYCFNKLPFGISSAPELFQRRMNKILEGLPGVVCLIDDVLVAAKDEIEHNARLAATLERLKQAGVTLNAAKCEFKKKSIKFLGHMVGEDGIRADPDKTAAISEMERPQTVKELRRFMGMVNQLGKFSSNIAETSQPLRELLRKNQAWVWGPDQEEAFKKIKQELAKPTVLAHYNTEAETKVSTDASSFGLGAVLLQKTESEWKPVAYASRSMSETERRYAQIEKEALAIAWSCEKFSDYLLGRRFLIESDHKPLIPILNTKSLNSLPPRVLRFRLRLSRFDYQVQHVAGKYMYTADTLSRAPSSVTAEEMSSQETEAFVEAIAIPSIPAGTDRLNAYREAQKQDPECTRVREYCQSRWPKKHDLDSDIVPYWKVRGSLTICEDLLLFNNRIVVPKPLRKETLSKIHSGHQGMVRCQQRVKQSVWWPGVNSQISQVVQECPICVKNTKNM